MILIKKTKNNNKFSIYRWWGWYEQSSSRWKTFKKLNDHSTISEKDYNVFKLQYNKQSVEEILIQRAMKMTIQTLYDEGLFDDFASADMY